LRVNGKYRTLVFGLIASIGGICATAGVYGQSESFHKGKPIRIIVGFTPGAFMVVGNDSSPRYEIYTTIA
jgi:hypothetical protein